MALSSESRGSSNNCRVCGDSGTAGGREQELSSRTVSIGCCSSTELWSLGQALSRVASVNANGDASLSDSRKPEEESSSALPEFASEKSFEEPINGGGDDDDEDNDRSPKFVFNSNDALDAKSLIEPGLSESSRENKSSGSALAKHRLFSKHALKI